MRTPGTIKRRRTYCSHIRGNLSLRGSIVSKTTCGHEKVRTIQAKQIPTRWWTTTQVGNRTGLCRYTEISPLAFKNYFWNHQDSLPSVSGVKRFKLWLKDAPLQMRLLLLFVYHPLTFQIFTQISLQPILSRKHSFTNTITAVWFGTDGATSTDIFDTRVALVLYSECGTGCGSKSPSSFCAIILLNPVASLMPN